MLPLHYVCISEGVLIPLNFILHNFCYVFILLIYLIDKDAEKKKNDTRESIKTNADVVAYSIIISGDGKDVDGPTTLSIRG